MCTTLPKKILPPAWCNVNFDKEKNAVTEYSLLKSKIKTCP
jgi:hypothetical protein